jgi:hypothetical protein
MKNVLLVQPTPEQQIHIRKTFNEDENTRDQALDTIKNWLRKQPHLPDTWELVESQNRRFCQKKEDLSVSNECNCELIVQPSAF